MKQLFFILIILIIGFFCYADDILIMTLFFQAIYLPDWNISYGINEYEYKNLNLNRAYEIKFGFDFYVKNLFFLKGSIKNIFHEKKDELSFYPDCDYYRIACGIRYKYFEIGYENFCFHPIFPYSANDRKENNALLEGSYNKYYLEIKLQSEI